MRSEGQKLRNSSINCLPLRFVWAVGTAGVTQPQFSACMEPNFCDGWGGGWYLIAIQIFIIFTRIFFFINIFSSAVGVVTAPRIYLSIGSENALNGFLWQALNKSDLFQYFDCITFMSFKIYIL